MKEILILKIACVDKKSKSVAPKINSHRTLKKDPNTMTFPSFFFAFQIGHIEIKKSQNLGVFGGHFEGLRADFW